LIDWLSRTDGKRPGGKVVKERDEEQIEYK
jgi:hypothetical protein